MTALSLQTAAALAEALSRLDSRADRLRKLEKEEAWRDAQDAKPIDWKAEADRWKASFENSERTVKRLLDQISKARGLFEELHEYLDGMSDIEDGDYGEPRANREMSLAIEINWMLEGLK